MHQLRVQDFNGKQHWHKALTISLVSLSMVAAALMVWRSQAHKPIQVEVVKVEPAFQPGLSKITVRLKPGSELDSSVQQQFPSVQAHIDHAWSEPNAVVPTDPMTFAVPSGADACRFRFVYRRADLVQRLHWLFSEHRWLRKFDLPVTPVADRILGRVGEGPMKEVTLDLKLPRQTFHPMASSAQSSLVPNIPLHWTGSSRFSLVSMATPLAAAPGQ